MPVPAILIVCPPPIQSPRGVMAAKFAGAERRCVGLAEAYSEVANSLCCYFFDAGSVTSSSRVDGVHLDRDQHLTLGAALAAVVEPLTTDDRAAISGQEGTGTSATSGRS